MYLAKTTKKHYFPALTGLRAGAAFFVYAYHYNPFKQAPLTSLLCHELGLLLGQLSCGVSIFFILSGFLITLRYGDNIELSWQWFKRYLQNRAARILPIYWLLTGITFGFYQFVTEWPPQFSVREKVAVLILNFTLLRAYFEQFLFTGLPQAWSLTVEESFYLSAPLLLWSLKSEPYWRLLVYAMGLLTLGFLLVALVGGRIPYGFLVSRTFILNATYFGYSLELMAGVALATWVKRHPALPRGHLPLTALGGLGILATLWATPHLHLTKGGDVVARPFVTFFTCLLFYGLLSERTRFRWILETKVLNLLVRSSFAFYLLHYSFLSVWAQQASLGSFGILLVLITTASILLYRFVEEPLNIALRAK